MANPCSRQLSAAAIAALLLSLAFSTVSHAHNGEMHGVSKDDAPQESFPPASQLIESTSAPTKPTTSTSQNSLVESLAPRTNAFTAPAPSLLQRSSLMATSLWREHHLQGGEFICALILAAPFGLIFLKRRAQANAALQRKTAQ